MGAAPNHSWLPDHQFHVAATLAHADAVIAQVGKVMNNYTKAGAFVLGNRRSGGRDEVVIAAVQPVPAALSRLAADALTQLRAALEHCLFAEVEFLLGRELDEREAKIIEMPAKLSEVSFAGWLEQGVRRTLPPLEKGGDLARRIHALQPLHRRDVDAHPLRVLTEHTNHMKHRSPSVAATMLGHVMAEGHAEDVVVARGDPQSPVTAGTGVASAPRGARVPISIWPAVSMRRPHTGSWHLIVKELAEVERWVREVAIPTILTGGTDVDHLRPELDVTVGIPDLRAALSTAGVSTAEERTLGEIQEEIAGEDLAELLSAPSLGLDPQTLRTWLASMSAQDVARTLSDVLAAAEAGNPAGSRQKLVALADEIRSHDVG